MISAIFTIILILLVAALCIYVLEWGLSFIGLSIDGRIVKILEAIIVVVALWRVIVVIMGLGSYPALT